MAPQRLAEGLGCPIYAQRPDLVVAYLRPLVRDVIVPPLGYGVVWGTRENPPMAAPLLPKTTRFTPASLAAS